MTPVVLILAGIGMWFFIEGAIYAVAPDFMRRMMRMISDMSTGEIIQAGLFSAALGAGIVYMAWRMAAHVPVT